MYILPETDAKEENTFTSANLHAQTKLGNFFILLRGSHQCGLDDDFLINVSIEKNEGKLTGFVRLRSKTKVTIVYSALDVIRDFHRDSWFFWERE